MALLNTLQIVNARERGHQSWTARLSEWGYAEAPLEQIRIQYDINYPIVGAQIHPGSDWGECFLEFNPGGNSPHLGPHGLAENQLLIRYGKPYFWRTPAMVSIFATVQELYGDAYFPVPAPGDAIAADDFGPALGAQYWWYPRLAVTVFFDHTPAIQAAPIYGPDHEEGWAIPHTFAINDLDEHVDGRSIWCIYHRRNLRLRVNNGSATDPVELRLCGVRNRTALAPEEFELYSTPFIVPPRRGLSIPASHPEAVWLVVHIRKQINSGLSTVMLGLYRDAYN